VLLVAVVLLMALLSVVPIAGAAKAARRLDEAGYDPGAIEPPEDNWVITIYPAAAWGASGSPWSTRRRLAAQPPARDEVTPELLAEAIAARKEPSIGGAPVFIPGSRPQPGADATARLDFPEEWPEEAVIEEDGVDSETQSARAGGGAYTAFSGNKYSQMWKLHPYNAIGKLYFDTPSGPGYCTASVIGPNLIVTAAQCVLDTNTDTVYTNFAFCPAARGSNCPYGMFPWVGIVLQYAYLEAASWVEVVDIDVALVHLESNRAGRSVHTYTGWLGRAWNLPPGQHGFAFGYPVTRQGSRFSSICAGAAFEAGIDVLEMGCDSGSGHLGGPWLVNFAPYVAESANYVNSVTAYQYTRGRNAIGGPRFSMENIARLCEAVPEC
jgi:hypothetical protein